MTTKKVNEVVEQVKAKRTTQSEKVKEQIKESEKAVNLTPQEVIEAMGLKFEVVEENLDKWNFQEIGKNIFVGIYKRKDTFHDKVQNKDFDLYVFEDMESGKRYHVDSSHTIQKTVENEILNNKDLNKTVFMIQFLGKAMLKGKPFNQFTISLAKL